MKRTKKQNDAIHPLFREISKELGNIGNEVVLKLSPTPECVKEFFVQKYLHGKRTSESDKAELAKAVDLFIDHMNAYLAEREGGPIMIMSEDAKSFINTYLK